MEVSENIRHGVGWSHGSRKAAGCFFHWCYVKYSPEVPCLATRVTLHSLCSDSHQLCGPINHILYTCLNCSWHVLGCFCVSRQPAPLTTFTPSPTCTTHHIHSLSILGHLVVLMSLAAARSNTRSSFPSPSPISLLLSCFHPEPSSRQHVNKEAYGLSSVHLQL